MNSETYVPGIGVTAGVYRLKWDMLNQHIHNHPINIQPGDDVNVFINFECILKNISMKRGLNTLVNFHKHQMVIELESAILNLMGNYKSYFNKEKCNVKLYFYYTSLDSKYNHHMEVYNKYYRNFYYNRYTEKGIKEKRN